MSLFPVCRLELGNKNGAAGEHKPSVAHTRNHLVAAIAATAGGKRALSMIGVLIVANAPLFAAFCLSLWDRPHYQFFPVVPIGAACLLVRRMKQDGIPYLIGGGGYLLPLTAWTLLAAGLATDTPWLGMFACLAVSAAMIVGVGGWRLFRVVYPAWCFLFLMIPAPFAIDEELIQGLQARTASWASSVLDLLGVYHHLMGNVVEIAGRRYLVEEACSGIHSLFAVFTCTLFYVLWQRRPRYHAVVLLSAAVCWVLVENVVRVAGVVAITSRLGIDLSAGWRHDAYGLALFCTTIGITWSTDRLLLFVFARRIDPVAVHGQAALTFPRVPLIDLRRSWLMSLPFAAAFIALGIAQLFLLPPLVWHTLAADSPSIAPTLAAITDEALPAEIGSWRRGEFQVLRGEHLDQMAEASHMWHYSRKEDRLTAVVSLDYPYVKFHDLSFCYEAIGWEVVEKTDKSLGDDPATNYVELRLRKRPGVEALVLFSAFDRTGRSIPRPLPQRGVGLVDRAQARLTAFAHLRLPDPPAPTQAIDEPVLQVQLFVESFQPLDENKLAEIRRLFRDSLKPLRARFAAVSETRPSATGAK